MAKATVDRVKVYKYSIPQTACPQFVYVDWDYDKSVLPSKVRAAIGKGKASESHICIAGCFGLKGKGFFDKYHYIGCELSFVERG